LQSRHEEGCDGEAQEGMPDILLCSVVKNAKKMMEEMTRAATYRGATSKKKGITEGSIVPEKKDIQNSRGRV